jgi:hypothetical protein
MTLFAAKPVGNQRKRAAANKINQSSRRANFRHFAAAKLAKTGSLGIQ